VLVIIAKSDLEKHFSLLLLKTTYLGASLGSVDGN
jgi:hypothetical protein